MIFLFLKESIVGTIKRAGGCVSNQSASTAFLNIFSFTRTADISVAVSIGEELENIRIMCHENIYCV